MPDSGCVSSKGLSLLLAIFRYLQLAVRMATTLLGVFSFSVDDRLPSTTVSFDSNVIYSSAGTWSELLR